MPTAERNHDGGDADELRPGSERSFGIVFAVVFALIGLWPVLWAQSPRWYALAIGGGFLALGFVAPALLRPLNWLWFRFGLLLHRVVSPLVMGGVFFLCVTPIGLIMRAFGKDVLSLRKRPDQPSYWIHREPPGPPPGMMKNQF